MHYRAQLIHAKFTQQLSPFSSTPAPKADSVRQFHPTAEMVIVLGRYGFIRFIQ